MVAREREEKTVMHLREMASIALMHVTPNGVKYPSGSVKPALRWFFEGNFRKLSENTKERHKGELRRLCEEAIEGVTHAPPSR